MMWMLGEGHNAFKVKGDPCADIDRSLLSIPEDEEIDMNECEHGKVPEEIDPLWPEDDDVLFGVL